LSACLARTYRCWRIEPTSQQSTARTCAAQRDSAAHARSAEMMIGSSESRAPRRLTGDRDQIQTRTGFTFSRHGLAFKRRKARRITASRTGNGSVTGRPGICRRLSVRRAARSLRSLCKGALKRRVARRPRRIFRPCDCSYVVYRPWLMS
jgi:hypothetical protein